ncbi:MAG TPA: lamin tail domain-containing protein, partial [Candidatus Eisenbacteria bacterium]|nr:lamin tail domain-containing protein [Candidatus Eisenbacteria bacterium]
MISTPGFARWHAAFLRRGSTCFRFTQIWLRAVLGTLLLGFPSFAQPSNLATNGTATGSTEGYGSVFADGNDGHRDGQFYSGGSVWHTVIPDANPYYEVDLGGTFFLDRVMIWPRTDVIQGTVRNFRLSVFDSTGQTVWQHDYLPNNAADNVWATTQLRNVEGRRVRLARLDQSGNAWLTFAEFEVWGQSAPIATNVALGKPITGTPGASLGTAVTAGNDGVIDGDYNHEGYPVYHSVNATTGEFWQVDLGAEQPLDYAIIFNRTDAADVTTAKLSIRNASDVQVFSTNVNITRGLTIRGGAQHDITVDWPGLVNGRYVRLETTASQYLSFAEVEVFGPPPPSPPTLAAVLPLAGEVLAELSQVDVTFSEPVLGVDAADLLINGSPASSMTTLGPTQFRFRFPTPANGTATLNWAAEHGIVDLDNTTFAGGGWSYQLNTNLPPSHPFISEFLADNQGGVRDEDLDSPDWIELFNPGPLRVNLAGWFLTDTSTNLSKWRFPATNLAANAYLVVFASNKDRTNVGAPLHANFKLDADGGYLALVKSDGTTVVSEFTYGPQRRNVSFGLGRALVSAPLLATGALARVLVPTNGLPDANWAGGSEPFDDSAWRSAVTGIGFDQSTNGGSSGLIAYWDFNDASDPTHAHDLSGRNHTGTLVSPAVFTADAGGRTGQAGDRSMNFGPALNNAYVSVPDAASGMFDTATAHDTITFSFWIYGDASEPANSSVFWASGNPDGSGARSAQAHLPWSDSVIYWDTAGCCDPAQTRVSVGEPDPAKWRGAWNHYVFLKNGDTKEIWQNGALLLQRVNAENLTSVRGFAIGALPGGSASYGGRVDDFAIWDTALTPAQIQSLAAGSSPLGVRKLTPLIATDVGAEMRGVSASALVRIPFAVADPSAYRLLLLRIRYDDGFVTYLNGVEVARRNAPNELAFNSTATVERPGGAALDAEEIDLSPFVSLLRAGNNLLAIHALNRTADDAELLVLPELYAGQSLANRYFSTPTPGAANNAGISGFVADAQCSTNGGYYAGPFDVTFWVPMPGATLVYTTDGSEPTLTNGRIAPGTNGTLHVTNTMVLRFAAFKDDYEPSAIETHSFFFAAKVAAQTRPPGLGTTWPGGAPTDFTMDARVVTNALPGYGLTNALLSIPTVSIVTPYD